MIMKLYDCGFYGLSFGAYLTVSKETYTLTEDGQQELVGEITATVVDLKTGKMMELMRDVDGTLPYMYGVWEDSVVYQTLETKKGAACVLKTESYSSQREPRGICMVDSIIITAFIREI